MQVYIMGVTSAAKPELTPADLRVASPQSRPKGVMRVVVEEFSSRGSRACDAIGEKAEEQKSTGPDQVSHQPLVKRSGWIVLQPVVRVREVSRPSSDVPDELGK